MDITDIKAENIKKILTVLRFSSGLTKRDLASIVGLSFSTVSNLCNELKDCQVLYEEKSSDYSVGRTPNRLIFRCEKFCSICADLQEENLLHLAVLDFSNRQLFQHTYDISGFTHVEQLITQISNVYQSLRSDPAFREVQFIGIGVSVPAIYDQRTRRVVNATSPLFNDTPLRDLLSQRLQLPCYVDNEANLCALSMRQSHTDSDNILYLHSSAGLGVGVVCDGKILRGSNGYAAEIAHIPLGDPEIRCPFCHSFGCIENDLSQRGMDIFHFPGLSPGERQRLLEDRGRKLGELISILVNLFDPSVLYVGGSGLVEYPSLAPYVEQVLRARSAMIMERGLPIVHDTNSLQTIEQGIIQVTYEKWAPLAL